MPIRWDDFPECKPFCPQIECSITFSTNCSLNDVYVDCMDPAEAGTIAIVTCKYGYDSVSEESPQTICGTDGRWELVPLQCKQVCSQRAEQKPVTLQDTAILQAPWHVSIYKRISVVQPNRFAAEPF